jgi:hypothetical protein
MESQAPTLVGAAMEITGTVCTAGAAIDNDVEVIVVHIKQAARLLSREHCALIFSPRTVILLPTASTSSGVAATYLG